MRIFVSSSFEDLREHRAAAIRVLRQLGHEVLAMEDLIAGSVAPLPKVLEMVNRSEAYVGLFAWRYGFVPGYGSAPSMAPTSWPQIAGATYGQTSITHYEYLRALERKLPILAFLLDEHCPWPPQLVDGFDVSRLRPCNAQDIRTLREQLQQERVVSWFTTPADLEARVGAAVTMAGLTRQLDLQPARALDPLAGVADDSSAESGITSAITGAGDRRALKIDLQHVWWSTRLYLIAALAERLTQARRILVVHTEMALDAAGKMDDETTIERFIGQLSTSSILSVIRPKVPALDTFMLTIQSRSPAFNDLHDELRVLLGTWYQSFGDQLGNHTQELGNKVDINQDLLRRWFGDALFEQPVHIADLQRASVVDLLRLLDYPNDFIPVLTRGPCDDSAAPHIERVDVMDKQALNARLARSYLLELMDRARIS